MQRIVKRYLLNRQREESKTQKNMREIKLGFHKVQNEHINNINMFKKEIIQPIDVIKSLLKLFCVEKILFRDSDPH